MMGTINHCPARLEVRQEHRGWGCEGRERVPGQDQ